MNKKDIAKEFLSRVINGDIDHSFKEFCDLNDFKHHNIYFREDAESLKHGMRENHNLFPNKQITFHQLMEDGDKVLTHSHVQLGNGQPGVQLIHIFRFSNDKIVEVWDIAQPLPDESPNTLGAF